MAIRIPTPKTPKDSGLLRLSGLSGQHHLGHPCDHLKGLHLHEAAVRQALLHQARRQAEAVGVHRDMLQGPVGAQRGTVLGIIHHEVVNHQATTRLQDFQGVPGAKMCVNISITGVNMWESSVVTVWFCLKIESFTILRQVYIRKWWWTMGVLGPYQSGVALIFKDQVWCGYGSKLDTPEYDLENLPKSQKGRIYTSRLPCARDRYGMASDIFQGCSGPAVVV